MRRHARAEARRLNRLRIASDEPEVVRTMLSLAVGDLHDAGLAAGLRDHTV
jgi:hypothetical protein